ncbi:hypothetical protein C7S18_21210 [Ahniella affigens]|uniref:Exo-alpha-sialidase n=1 Tax=Ahniella affigens TaxID=2021234 RepID=A0A2P1PXH1_9GAMM|nr:sialidase family protein [Ahniella affigens]AVP99537.1 hypothetical protein C7S18_21210 [Ahniella affigens]
MRKRDAILKSVLAISALAINGASGASSLLLLQPIDLPGSALPSVATVRGGFVLTTQQRDGSDAQLTFAELDRDGNMRRRGTIAEGRNWFVNWADFPSLVETDDGDWVSFFLAKSDPNQPYAYDVRLVRSKDRGQTWSAPLTVHDDGTSTEHGFVTLLPAGGNDVLVSWLDARHGAAMAGDGDHEHEGSHTAIHAARVDGAMRVVAHWELDELTCDCCNTDGRRIGNDSWIVYRNRSPEEIRDIHAVRFDGTGWSLPKRVLRDDWKITGCPVNGPAMASLDGLPLVFWPTQQGTSTVLRLALHDHGFVDLGVIERGEGVLGRVDAVAFGRDQALLSWLGVDGDETVLRVGLIDAAGKVLEIHDVTRLPPGRMTGIPRLAAMGRQALVVWTDASAAPALKIRGALIRALDTD